MVLPSVQHLAATTRTPRPTPNIIVHILNTQNKIVFHTSLALLLIVHSM
jgi:hypothetical protein